MTDAATIAALAEKLEEMSANFNRNAEEFRISHDKIGPVLANEVTRRADLAESAATALRALLAERVAIKPFIDLAVATTVEGSPDYREWVGQAKDWTIVLAFAGRSITLGQLRALAATATSKEHK